MTLGPVRLGMGKPFGTIAHRGLVHNVNKFMHTRAFYTRCGVFIDWKTIPKRDELVTCLWCLVTLSY